MNVTSPIDHFKGVENRKKSEKWAQRLMEEARENPVAGKENVALYAFANATDLKGHLLPLDIASVELLNIIRPTVALTVWAALMGHALFSRPDLYQQLKNDFSGTARSVYSGNASVLSIFPNVTRLSLKDVEVDGYRIPKDSWVI